MPNIRVLGIDPGFGRTGIGIVEFVGGDPTHVWHEVVETAKEEEFTERLRSIRDQVADVVRRFKPNCAAVELLFFQSNARTAMKVGMARGVILLALADAGLPVVELTPNQLKQGISGYGAADKGQVKDMVKRQLHLERAPKLDDAADALALAIVGGMLFRANGKQLTTNNKQLTTDS